MRLDFKVLWFENQMDGVRQAASGMKRALADHGLRLELDQQADASRLEELARHQELYHDYDLVIVDWDLGDGQPKGDEVAKRIRNSFGFTDIIFYSGKATDQLRDMVKDQAIDGVYCSGRTELRAKLIDHVEYVVERLSRLEAMRGLAVVSAGRCDDHMREVVRLAFERMTEEKQADLLQAIDKRVIGSAASHAKKYGKTTNLEEKLTSRALTSAILYEIATMALSQIADSCPDSGPLLKILETYRDDVIMPRNALGHIVETREIDGWVIRYAGAKELNKQGLGKIRKDLGRHLDNFSNLTHVLAIPFEA